MGLRPLNERDSHAWLIVPPDAYYQSDPVGPLPLLSNLPSIEATLWTIWPKIY